MLFSNLDETSNKGLIKGLIKLCHIQDKKVKQQEVLINKLKVQSKMDINNKDKAIKQISNELTGLRSSLKGCNFKFINFSNRWK